MQHATDDVLQLHHVTTPYIKIITNISPLITLSHHSSKSHLSCMNARLFRMKHRWTGGLMC